MPDYASCDTERPIKVFYSAFEKNHPAGNATDPNYYYYYMQTSAKAGSPLYGTNGSQISLHPPYTYYVESESEASGKEIFSPGANAGEELSYIDLFAWACRHEKSHYDDFSTWWGTTGRTCPNDPDDTDVDWMPDSRERTMPTSAGGPYDPDLPDSHPADDYSYPELPDSQRHACMTAEEWTEGSADEEDWAYPGNQWNP